ncbi:hypothetical protein NKI78_04535 [Mesorhizobium sp. M0400]|uniref:hypothetical protein n=1 Tax=Mesorhizobium sp. M0400 TaxID=2956941 RepID=UPI00333D19DF
MSQQYGRKPSRPKLLWWSFTELNWGGYVLAVFLIAMVCVLIASATGIIPTKWGAGSECAKGMSVLDSCEQ